MSNSDRNRKGSFALCETSCVVAPCLFGGFGTLAGNPQTLIQRFSSVNSAFPEKKIRQSPIIEKKNRRIFHPDFSEFLTAVFSFLWGKQKNRTEVPVANCVFRMAEPLPMLYVERIGLFCRIQHFLREIQRFPPPLFHHDYGIFSCGFVRIRQPAAHESMLETGRLPKIFALKISSFRGNEDSVPFLAKWIFRKKKK